MMGDLIDRQAAIDALGEQPMVWTDSDYELGRQNQYDSDVSAIQNVPTIDAVEVVRCKDCTKFTQVKDELGSCSYDNSLKMRQYTDYCSWAERRIDETD